MIAGSPLISPRLLNGKMPLEKISELYKETVEVELDSDIVGTLFALSLVFSLSLISPKLLISDEELSASIDVELCVEDFTNVFDFGIFLDCDLLQLPSLYKTSRDVCGKRRLNLGDDRFIEISRSIVGHLFTI